MFGLQLFNWLKLMRKEAVRDKVKLRGVWTLEKFHGDIMPGDRPYEVQVHENLFVYGGISCLWECLIGNGTASAGQALTYFNNAQAAIGVGDSTTAAAATQTDLQASTNKFRAAMNASYPTHTDGTTSGSASITFQSTFTSGQANYVWAEAGVFNSASAGTGRMFSRLVQALGQKTSPSSWQIGAQLSVS